MYDYKLIVLFLLCCFLLVDVTGRCPCRHRKRHWKCDSGSSDTYSSESSSESSEHHKKHHSTSSNITKVASTTVSASAKTAAPTPATTAAPAPATTAIPALATTAASALASTASTMVNPCASCKRSELTITQGSLIGEMPIISNGLITEANGCVSANVVCDASSVAGAIVRMEFNNGEIDGPSANQMATVVARLTCGEDEKWYFNEGTIANQIFEVGCSSTACGVCAVNSLTLLSANSKNGEIMASIPSGCTVGTIDASSGSLQIICQNPIATGGIAINYFDSNGVGYILPGATGTSTMTVNCINGVWTYQGATVASVVCLLL